MAKPPPVQRFKISCEVEAAHLGPIIAQLTMMGLTNVHFDLITDVRSFARNAKPEVPSQDFLAEWIKEHPTFRAIEAVNAFEAAGRSRGACYPALGVLVGKRLLKKLGPGEYSRADVKALAAPKKKRIAKGSRKTFDRSGEDVILTYAKRNHGRFNTPKLVEIFAAEGRARNSVYASIDALMKTKLVKRVGDAGSGQYILLAKASKPAKAPAKPTNGGGAEVVTNG